MHDLQAFSPILAKNWIRCYTFVSVFVFCIAGRNNKWKFSSMPGFEPRITDVASPAWLSRRPWPMPASRSGSSWLWWCPARRKEEIIDKWPTTAKMVKLSTLAFLRGKKLLLDSSLVFLIKSSYVEYDPWYDPTLSSMDVWAHARRILSYQLVPLLCIIGARCCLALAVGRIGYP